MNTYPDSEIHIHPRRGAHTDLELIRAINLDRKLEGSVVTTYGERPCIDAEAEVSYRVN